MSIKRHEDIPPLKPQRKSKPLHTKKTQAQSSPGVHWLERIKSLQLHVDTVHLGHFATVADKAGVAHRQAAHLHTCVHLFVCTLKCWKKQNYVISSNIVLHREKKGRSKL